LKKSFLAGEQKVLGLLMRSARGDMSEHIVSRKNDHGRRERNQAFSVTDISHGPDGDVQKLTLISDRCLFTRLVDNTAK
jgi:hypothetical protein